jgi:uncharacterized protein
VVFTPILMTNSKHLIPLLHLHIMIVRSTRKPQVYLFAFLIIMFTLPSGCHQQRMNKLRRSIEAGTTNALAIYLKQRGDPNARFPRSYARDARPYILQVAAQGGNISNVAALLRGGARVNVQDDVGWSALIYAMDGGETNSHYATFHCLLSAGADPNLIDSRGNTALHVAARFGFLHHVEELLSKGANPLSRNSNGNTPRDVAETPALKSLLAEAERRWRRPSSDSR